MNFVLHPAFLKLQQKVTVYSNSTASEESGRLPGHRPKSLGTLSVSLAKALVTFRSLEINVLQ